MTFIDIHILPGKRNRTQIFTNFLWMAIENSFVTQWVGTILFFSFFNPIVWVDEDKFWGPDCVGSWEQTKGKGSIAWVPLWFVGTSLIVIKLFEKQLNLELISTISSLTYYFVNLKINFGAIFLKNLEVDGVIIDWNYYTVEPPIIKSSTTLFRVTIRHVWSFHKFLRSCNFDSFFFEDTQFEEVSRPDNPAEPDMWLLRGDSQCDWRCVQGSEGGQSQRYKPGVLQWEYEYMLCVSKATPAGARQQWLLQVHYMIC